MDHVNNAVYADWLDEAVIAAGGACRRPRRPAPGPAGVRPGRGARREARRRRLAGWRRRGSAGWRTPTARTCFGRASSRSIRRGARRSTPLPRPDGGRMSQTFDPVASPEAYRASLLAALGDDDPAVAQAETAAAIRALVAEAGDRLRVRPSRANGPCSNASATSPTRRSSSRPVCAGSWPRTSPTSSATTRRCGSPARAQRGRPGTPAGHVRGAARRQPGPLGAAPGRGPRARRPSSRARAGELRHDLPAQCRARPDPPGAGAPGARR